MRFDPTIPIYIGSMGKALRVTAVFADDDSANRHMEKTSNEDAVVAVFGNLVILADVHDNGVPMSPDDIVLTRVGDYRGPGR